MTHSRTWGGRLAATCLLSLTALAVVGSPAPAVADGAAAVAAPNGPPPAGLPPGAIVAFLPDPESPHYRDTASLARWLDGYGFALCDGANGTPDLNYRMLLGTVHPEEAGASIGSRTHDHRMDGETGHARGRQESFLSGRGHLVRVPEDGHRHHLTGTTAPAEHLPLSLRVLFIMKVR